VLRDWLQQRIYRHGRKFMPTEMIERVTGGRIDPAPFLRYVSAKVDELYGA
jgi:carboxypeptidase Taq